MSYYRKEVYQLMCTRFVHEYLKDFCGKDAAIRAGFSKNRAKSTASELLAKPDILQMLRREIEHLTSQEEVTPEMVIAGYKRIANAKLTDYLRWGPDGVEVIPSDELPEEILLALQSVTIRETVLSGEVVKRTFQLRLEPRKTGLDGLAKYFDLFHEKEKATAMGEALGQALTEAYRKAYDEKPVIDIKPKEITHAVHTPAGIH